MFDLAILTSLESILGGLTVFFVFDYVSSEWKNVGTCSHAMKRLFAYFIGCILGNLTNQIDISYFNENPLFIIIPLTIIIVAFVMKNIK